MPTEMKIQAYKVQSEMTSPEHSKDSQVKTVYGKGKGKGIGMGAGSASCETTTRVSLRFGATGFVQLGLI
jgi:hypothetical protein